MAEGDIKIVAKELRDRSEAELRSLLASKREELFGFKFKHALGQLRETHTIKTLKRDIARINTVLQEQAKSAGEQA